MKNKGHEILSFWLKIIFFDVKSNIHRGGRKMFYKLRQRGFLLYKMVVEICSACITVILSAVLLIPAFTFVSHFKVGPMPGSTRRSSPLTCFI